MKKIFIIVYLTISAALTPVAAKYVVEQVSPLSLAYFRFGLATVILIVVFLIRNLNFKIDKKDLPKFLFLGALVIPVNQFFFLEGIKLSTASFSGVMYACTPLFIYIIAIFRNDETFYKTKMISIALSITGIVLIFWEGLMRANSAGLSTLTGDAFLFFAVLSWSFYLALSKNPIAKYGTLKTSTIAFIIGMIFYIPVFIFDYKNFTLAKLDIYGFIGFFYLSVLVAFGGYFIYSYSTKIVPTSTLTTLTNSSPIITIIFSYILLKEDLSYFFLIGSIVTILGVFIASRVDKKLLKVSILNE